MLLLLNLLSPLTSTLKKIIYLEGFHLYRKFHCLLIEAVILRIRQAVFSGHTQLARDQISIVFVDLVYYISFLV